MQHLPLDFCKMIYHELIDVDGILIDPYGDGHQAGLKIGNSYSPQYGMLQGWSAIIKKIKFVEGQPIRVEIPTGFTDHFFICFD